MAVKKVKLETVKEVLVGNKGKKLDDSVIENIIKEVENSSKINAKVIEKDGKKLAFCNYFGEYLPLEEFAVKENGKIPSMSKEGQRLARTQKSLVNKAITSLTAKLRAKEITLDEFNKLMDQVEAARAHKFEKGAVVPETYPFKF